MCVRLPSSPAYAPHVVVEYHWVAKLAPNLSVQVPEPLALGQPDKGYPWGWLVNRWIDGDDLEAQPIHDLVGLARDLAGFLRGLHKIDATGAPGPNTSNFFRGAHPSVYDAEAVDAIARASGGIYADAATEVWSQAMASEWHGPPRLGARRYCGVQPIGKRWETVRDH